MTSELLSGVFQGGETGDSCQLTRSSPRRSSLGLLPSGLRPTTVSGGSPRMYLQAQSGLSHQPFNSSKELPDAKDTVASNTAEGLNYSEYQRSSEARTEDHRAGGGGTRVQASPLPFTGRGRVTVLHLSTLHNKGAGQVKRGL